MQDLRQSEINLFLQMIKTSIDGTGKNRIIKSRNSPLKFSIVHDTISKKRSETNRSESCIINQLSFDKQQDKERKKNKQGILEKVERGLQPIKDRKQKSFYQVYNEDVVKKFRDQKGRNKSMRMSKYRPASISEVNNIKLKSFQFDPLIPEQEVAKYFRSDELSPIRIEKNRKKEIEKYRQRQREVALDKSVQKSKQKSKQRQQRERQIFCRMCTPKSGADWIEGKRKELSTRFYPKIIPQTIQKSEQLSEDQCQYQPFSKLKIGYHNYRLSVAKTPEPIKSNTSYIHLNFKKRQEIKIDAWVTNDDY